MSFHAFTRVVLLPALLGGLIAALTSGVSGAQSLGDVARQEQARRKSAASGKVYTNGDLRGAPAPAATTPSTPSSPATSAGTSGDAKSNATGDAKSDRKADAKSDGKTASGDAKGTDASGDKPKATSDPAEDEATWRKKRQNIQEALDRARTFSDALQSRINGLTAEFSAKDDPAQRSVVATERQKALTELERVKKEIQQHTDALADLQEEARKSGVPAGWLR